MPLVRIRHTQPDGRERWLETVVPADEADALVWSTDPANAAVFELVGRGEVELIEEKTARPPRSRRP